MAKIYEFEGQQYELPDDATEQELHDFILGSQKQSSFDQYKEFQKSIGENRTPFDTMRDLISGALTGIGQGGQAIGEQIEKVPGFGKLQKFAQEKTGFSMPRTDVEKAFEGIASPNKSIGGEITKGIGSYAPYGALGGAGLAGQIGAGLAHGAATTQPEENRLLGQGRPAGAMQEALVNALTHGAFKGIEKLRPSRLLRGTLTPEELKENLRVTSGTNTALGDVIGSPMLKRQLENVLTKIPFSGANKKLQETGMQVINKGENFLNKLLGENSPQDIGETLNERLIDTFKNKVEPEKNAIYEKVNKIAEKNNLTPKIDKFADALKRNKNALENLTILRGEPLNNALFEKVANATGELGSMLKVDITGQPIVKPSFREANILKGALLSAAKKAKSSPMPEQRALANVYNDLGNSLRSDVHESISASNNPKLIHTYHKAEENYKNNFSGFLDKDIYKYLQDTSKSDDLIQAFLKMSNSSDKAKQLNKLTSKLSDEDRNLLAYGYFSRAMDNEGNVDPAKLATLTRKLKKNQLETLVPDPIMRKEISDYQKLYGMNTKAVKMMANPETGQQNLDVLSALGLIKGGAGLSTMLGTKPVVNYLTSPESREALIKAMLENKNLVNPRTIQALQAGTQGLVNG